MLKQKRENINLTTQVEVLTKSLTDLADQKVQQAVAENTDAMTRLQVENRNLEDQIKILNESLVSMSEQHAHDMVDLKVR